jgi:hypothetical protein
MGIRNNYLKIKDNSKRYNLKWIRKIIIFIKI